MKWMWFTQLDQPVAVGTKSGPLGPSEDLQGQKYRKLAKIGIFKMCKKDIWSIYIPHDDYWPPNAWKPPPKSRRAPKKGPNMAKNGQKCKNAIFSAFPRCPILKFFLVTRVINTQILAPMPAPVNLVWICTPSRAVWITIWIHQQTLIGPLNAFTSVFPLREIPRWSIGPTPNITNYLPSKPNSCPTG